MRVLLRNLFDGDYDCIDIYPAMPIPGILSLIGVMATGLILLISLGDEKDLAALRVLSYYSFGTTIISLL